MLGYTTPGPADRDVDVARRQQPAGRRRLAGHGPRRRGTVVLTSKAFGHLGGNSLAAQIDAPAAGAANQALSVALAGNRISINPATDANGAITSTAAQVVAAINAHPTVSTLVKASLWRTNTGAGVVQAGPSSPLSDLLRAPATTPRGPQDQYMLRVGKVRDGSKVGVFFYCQEHGNEIATSGVCLETAERLVRNYGTDARTTALVDNLDIFIIPQINGDGATHSLYDSNRRKNLSNYCEDTAKFPSNDTDPAQRNSWGVDMNRNFQIGSVFDGFQGASTTNCLSGNFTGPFEHSEPEVRNETWVQTTFRNIKFANNIHSNGGLFMWPPGAYTPARVPLPVPAVRHAELLRPDGQERPRRDQGAPRHDDRPVADGSRDRRALLGRRQLRGRGVLRQRDHRFRLRDRDHQLLQEPDHRRRSRAAAPASSRRSATRRTTASTTRASTRRWSTPAATSACSTPRWRTGPTRPRPVVQAGGNAVYGTVFETFGLNCGILLQQPLSPPLDARNNYWGSAQGPGPDPADAVCTFGSPAGVLVQPVAKKEIRIPMLW